MRIPYFKNIFQHGFLRAKRSLRRFVINSPSNQQPEEINFHGIQFTVWQIFKQVPIQRTGTSSEDSIDIFARSYDGLVHNDGARLFCSVIFSAKVKKLRPILKKNCHGIIIRTIHILHLKSSIAAEQLTLNNTQN